VKSRTSRIMRASRSREGRCRAATGRRLLRGGRRARNRRCRGNRVGGATCVRRC
jgi:hypothetical protein